MIVFDLRCDGGHVFEAWFGSTAAYEDQLARTLIRCPLCDSTVVSKALMAPAIGAKGNTAPPPAVVKAALQALASAQKEVLKDSTWVGGSFATRARAMHDGAEPHATIHGQATPAEAKALVDDGVPIAPLPLPIVPPDVAN